jgi:hypothetical protein
MHVRLSSRLIGLDDDVDVGIVAPDVTGMRCESLVYKKRRKMYVKKGVVKMRGICTLGIKRKEEDAWGE